MLLTHSNGQEVADYCGGEAFDVAMMPGFCHHVQLGTQWIIPGDSVTRDPDGFIRIERVL